MRIVEINGGANGSTGKIMFGIAKIAMEQDHEVMCAAPITSTNRDAKRDCGYYRIGNYTTRRINVLMARITGLNGCFAWVATYKLFKKIKEFAPDVIQLHNLHDSYINLPMLFHFIKKKHIPAVWTLHDCWAFTGHCPHFTVEKCDKWETGCYGCPRYCDYPVSLFDNSRWMWKLKKKRFTGVANMTIVTPSKWLANLVERSYLSRYQVKVVNNGIDLNVFKPTQSDFRVRNGIKDDECMILGVAFGWSYKKGIDCFVDLANKLDRRFRIVLVGTDSSIDKKLPSNIISVHRTKNQNELARIYSAADVLFMPTREENFPTVNLEALACGTPVITFNTGGSPETIDETCGYIVDGNDLDSVVAILKRGSTRKDSIAVENCVKRAEKFCDTETYRTYMRLYNDVCFISN